MINTSPHPWSTACADVHCSIHDIDEVRRGYRWCIECGHVYWTARELRRLYRRSYWRVDAEAPLWLRLWTVVSVRASRIGFCQYCPHDFPPCPPGLWRALP